MDHHEIPSKPLYANVDNKVEPAKFTYFFQKQDGTYIHVQTEEAWRLYARGNQRIGPGREIFKLIGRSDGKIFQQAVLESKKIFREQGLEAAQNHLREAELKELEAARLNPVAPPDMDVKGSGAAFINRFI